MPKKHLCFWPNLRHQPKTAFSRLPPLHRANLEGRLRVEGGSCRANSDRLRWADSRHSLLRPEGVVASKERTFLDDASQDSLQPQISVSDALLDSLP